MIGPFALIVVTYSFGPGPLMKIEIESAFLPPINIL